MEKKIGGVLRKRKPLRLGSNPELVRDGGPGGGRTNLHGSLEGANAREKLLTLA